MKLLSKNLFILFLLSISSFGFAQSKMQLGVSLGAAIPMDDDFGDLFETGFGGNVKFSYFFKENLAFNASLGYYSFELESNDDWKYKSVPLLLNVDYYFKSSKVKPYIGGGLGVYFNSLDYDDNGIFDDDDRYDDTEIGINLGGGLLFEVGNKINLGGDLRFNIMENTSFMNLNFGVFFDL